LGLSTDEVVQIQGKKTKARVLEKTAGVIQPLTYRIAEAWPNCLPFNRNHYSQQWKESDESVSDVITFLREPFCFEIVKLSP
jgi:hypothetical protein